MTAVSTKSLCYQFNWQCVDCLQGNCVAALVTMLLNPVPSLVNFFSDGIYSFTALESLMQQREQIKIEMVCKVLFVNESEAGLGNLGKIYYQCQAVNNNLLVQGN